MPARADYPESVVISRGPCPKCGSRDNLHTYSDGHTWCFTPDCGRGDRVSGDLPDPQPRSRLDLIFDTAVEPIPGRGLTLETCEKYGYRVGRFKGSAAHFAAYQKGGRVVGQHIRFRNDAGEKDFAWAGDSHEPELFGQHLFRDGGKMVVVTEGEIDAMSVGQVFGLKWPAVSLPNGAGNARKDLARALPWLEKFAKVVLLFDQDEAGRTAVEAVVDLFTPGKLYVASLPLKDASDMLKGGRGGELVDAVWGAKEYRPDGIRTVDDLIEEALKPAEYGLPWPWRTLTERTYGIHRNHVYGWGAGVGSGKTSTMHQLMLTAMRPDLIEPHDGLPLVIPEPRPIGTILFEEKPAKTLRTLAGMALGIRLKKPGVEPDPAEVRAVMESFRPLFFPVDMFGARDWDTVKSRLRYLALSAGVRDLFVDPLTALVADEEDERRALDSIMADLAGTAESLNLTIHYVSHLTTPQGTPHEEGGRVMEKHFTGSRALARWTHAMFGLERDKQDRNAPTILRGLKDREYGEAVGPLLALHYDGETGRMVEVPLPTEDQPFSDETHHDV